MALLKPLCLEQQVCMRSAVRRKYIISYFLPLNKEQLLVKNPLFAFVPGDKTYLTTRG
jgi:hypothetical protein